MRTTWGLAAIAVSLAAAGASAAAAPPPPHTQGSCEQIVQVASDLKCQYARSQCHQESIISYVALYYCHIQPAGTIAITLSLAAAIALLLLLFRMLSTTAEDFFSPILTQLSQELGLPPRFAGVSLLAIGNGAPDLSASIAAVRSGSYHLALGSLLGGGMFVGSVVAGCVVLASHGAKARGALLRDVGAYAAAVAVLAGFMLTGHISTLQASLLVAMYIGFVLIVLFADLAHLLRVRRKQQKLPPEALDELDPDDLHQPLMGHATADREEARSAGPPSSASPAADRRSPAKPHADPPLSSSSIELAQDPPHSDWPRADHSPGLPKGAEEQPAVGDRGDPPGGWRPQGGSPGSRAASGALPDRWGDFKRGPGSRRGSEQLAHQRGSNGSGSDEHRNSTYEERLHMPGSAYRAEALATLAHSHTFFYGSSEAPDLVLEDGSEDPESGLPDEEQTAVGNGVPVAALPRSLPDAGVEFQGLPVPRDRRSVRMLQRTMTTGTQAFNGVSLALSRAGEVLGVAETPVLLLRRATVPLIDAENFDRRWLLLALFCAPCAALLYLRSPLLPWGLLVGAAAAGAAAAALAGHKEGDPAPAWRWGTPVPIGAALVAYVGLVIAAMWVDTIASELVALLEFWGVLLHIDHAVLGLTVLAWGNSLGDLSTNLAMTRRGLSNMAMTACYAGPVITLLMGMGLGFLNLCDARKVASVPVQLSRNELAGAIVIMLNCLGLIGTGVVLRGRLPRWYGGVLLAMYGVFMGVSLLMLWT